MSSFTKDYLSSAVGTETEALPDVALSLFTHHQLLRAADDEYFHELFVELETAVDEAVYNAALTSKSTAEAVLLDGGSGCFSYRETHFLNYFLNRRAKEMFHPHMRRQGMILRRLCDPPRAG